MSHNAFSYLAATNRKQFRIERCNHQKNIRLFPHVLKPVAEEEFLGKFDQHNPPVRVWLSREFMVAEWLEGKHSRLSINRTAIDNDGLWKDKITWDELMEVKRQIGYGSLWAVEIFPADEHVVNVAPMRHLWIVEQPPFGWVNKSK